MQAGPVPLPAPRDRVEALRATLAGLERKGGPPLAIRTGFAPSAREGETGPVRLGSASLDAALGGGLRRGTLNEIVAAHRQDDGAAAGFATALAICCAGSGPLVWIVEDCVTFETGTPYRPGLAAHGLDPDRLLLVRTARAEVTLWAAEEALRAGAPVVLAEIWNSRSYDLVASRRLALAAQSRGGLALLLHTGLSGQAETLSSTADSRFSVAACPTPRLPSAGSRLPLPGAAAFAVRLVKLRFGTGRGFDAERIHPLVWTPAKRGFDDHPVSLDVSPLSADRSAEASRQPQRARG